MNAVNLIRSLLFVIFLAIFLMAGLSLLKATSSATEHTGLFLLLFSIMFLLILGPFWPSQRNLNKWSDFFDRHPVASGSIGYFILAVTGAAISANCMQFADNHPSRKSLRLVYDLLGQEGVALIWFIFGVGLFAISVWRLINIFQKAS